MTKAQKIGARLIFFTVTIAAGVYFFPEFRAYLDRVVEGVKGIAENRQEIAQELREEIFSSPLTGSEDAAEPALDPAGVVGLTNAERNRAGLPSLSANAKLAYAAKLKLDDMFAKQYFEHISPDGHGPGYVVDKAGYNYIVVGENLALGNFKDNAALVAAWMESPGHRENILNNRYTEIGVAVGQGTYQGKKVWLAVQEFGKPITECPQTDSSLRARIDSVRAQANRLSADLEARRAKLDSMMYSTPEESRAYNQEVAEYNATVKSYNAVVAELKSLIDRYNSQIRAFNACIKR